MLNPTDLQTLAGHIAEAAPDVSPRDVARIALSLSVEGYAQAPF